MTKITYYNCPYHLEYETVTQPPPYWATSVFKVYNTKTNELAFQFDRNYNHMKGKVFYPFKKDNVWYALYSTRYTATRVVNLDTGLDVCGEDPSGFGFCPVEFYVPLIRKYKIKLDEPDKDYLDYTVDAKNDSIESHRKDTILESETYNDLGFVAGCIWGDDSTWKIEALDLSQVPNKITRIQPFGYSTLPDANDLKESITIVPRWEDRGDYYIKLTHQTDFFKNKEGKWESGDS